MWKINEKSRKNIEDENGQTFLCYNEEEAEELCNFLNKKYGNWEFKVKPTTVPYHDSQIHEDFLQYDNLMKWLNKTSKRLTELDEIYNEEFKVELSNAIENGVDFKKIYGGNTEKTRKQYVDEQLSDIIDEKNLLKAHQSDDLKRIEFLKRLIDYKIKLIGYHETPVSHDLKELTQ